MSRLQQFLDDNLAEGVYDSSGNFELSLSKALAKLTEFGCLPGEWILKCVQAAVLSGGPALLVKQTRHATRIQFRPDRLPSIEELERSLLEPQHRGEPYLTEFCIGLRSLLKDDRFEIQWAQSRMSWDGTRMELQTTSEPAEAITLSVLYGGWLDKKRREGQAQEAEFLQTRATYCPIHLWLDNRLLSLRDLAPYSCKSDHGPNSPWHLAAGYLPRDRALGNPEPIRANLVRDPTRSPDPLLFWDRGSDVSGSFSLFAREYDGMILSDLFEIRWTRYGVVCGSTAVSRDSPLGGFLQLPGDHLRSDLAGLSLAAPGTVPDEAAKKMEQLIPPLIQVRTEMLIRGKSTVAGDLPGLLWNFTWKTSLAVGAVGLGLVFGVPYWPKSLSKAEEDPVRNVAYAVTERLKSLIELLKQSATEPAQ